MPEAASDPARWDAARTVAADLAESGVDPLDVEAAVAARTALVRRFVLDLLLIFAIVAVVAPVVLMVMRAIAGEDPVDGREIWIASAALLLLLSVVAARARSSPRVRRPTSARGRPSSIASGPEPRRAMTSAPPASRSCAVRPAIRTGAFPSVAPGRRKA